MMVASAGFGQGKRAIMPPRQRINFYEYAVSLGIGRLHQRNVLVTLPPMPILPSPIELVTARLPARHRAAGGEFLRFGLVGAFGFSLDVAVVYALNPWIGLYAAGMVAYFVAASANWALNRVWTFRGRAHRAAHTQWMRFLAVNLFGFMLNRGAYSALIAAFVLPRHYPVLAVAAGAATGFLVNFLLSRRVVFG